MVGNGGNADGRRSRAASASWGSTGAHASTTVIAASAGGTAGKALVPRPAVWRSLLRPGTIGGKLARVLAMFLVTVLVLLGIIVASEVRNYQAAGDTVEAVKLTLSIQDLVHELQRERGLTNGLLAGDERFRPEAVTQRGKVDGSRVALERLAAGGGLAADANVTSTLQRLAGLTEIRGSVDAGRAVRATVFTYYSDAIDALNSVDAGLSQAQDQTLREQLTALRALGDAKEAAAQERGFLNGIFATNHFTRDEYAQFADIRATKRAALDEFDQHASAQRRAEADAVLGSPAATKAAANEAAALGGADGRPLGVEAHLWWSAMTTLIDDLRTVQTAVGSDIEARAGTLRDDATRHLLEAALVVGLAVTLQLALATAGSRAITRPLAQLVAEANEVATRRLPDAVARILSSDAEPEPPEPVSLPARAATEIRSVAEALDEVQQSAHRLAVEQVVLRRNTTESLANLGRRTQNLLRRQLGFISRLEREEADATALSNLFELDHLATRMRRNAESLLVLVGEESPRVWSTPLPVTDVIRASISEVEEYRRVVLRRIDEAYVAGGVVSDVAHMIAELVENGLAFSPPDADVEIFGRWAGSRYLIAVVDQGVGMTPEDLTRSNARLRGSESFLVAPTRFLGHYVVGRLAERLSVEVQLSESPVTGITARLLLPNALLAHSQTGATPSTLAEPAPREAVAEISATAAWSAADHSAAPQTDPVSPSHRPDPAPHRPAPHRPFPSPHRQTPLPTNATAPLPRNATDPASGNGTGPNDRPTPATPGSAWLNDRGVWPLDGGANGATGKAPVPPTGAAYGPSFGRRSDSGTSWMTAPWTDAAAADAPSPVRAPSPRAAASPGPVLPNPVQPGPVPPSPVQPGPVPPSPMPPSWPLSTPTVPAARDPEAHAAAEHTRNGLVKRVPRSRLAQHPPYGHPRADRDSVVAERAPEDVRTMLSSFRAGHRRGETFVPDDPSALLPTPGTANAAHHDHEGETRDR